MTWVHGTYVNVDKFSFCIQTILIAFSLQKFSKRVVSIISYGASILLTCLPLQHILQFINFFAYSFNFFKLFEFVTVTIGSCCWKIIWRSMFNGRYHIGGCLPNGRPTMLFFSGEQRRHFVLCPSSFCLFLNISTG